MFAFTRVIGVYILTAALLTWALFAFGLTEEMELPGFEQQKTPTAAPVVLEQRSPSPAPPPEQKAEQKTAMVRSEPPPEPPKQRPVEPAPPPVSPASPPPVAKAPDPPPVAPPPAVKAAPPPVVAKVEPEPAIKRPEKSPEKAAPPPAVQSPPLPPKMAAAPSPPLPPVTVAPPATLPAAPKMAAPSEPVRAPPPPPAAAVAPPPPPQVRQQPGLPPPPRVAEPSPPARAPETAPPARKAAPAQPPPAAAPQQPSTAAVRNWVPTRRVAGFGADALVDELEDIRRSRDDLPCVTFDRVRFRAGTAQPMNGVPRELDLIATSLGVVPNVRVEIGSRIGTTNMNIANQQLAAQRVRFVHDQLVRRGVPPERLMMDLVAGYHELMDDVTRATARRVPSIGVCVLPVRG